MNRLIEYVSSSILFLVVLSVSGCGQPNDLQVQFRGRTYAYHKVHTEISDLRSQLVNTRQIETDHCRIIYCYDFEKLLPEMIALSEEDYLRISNDFLYHFARGKPLIRFLSHQQYQQYRALDVPSFDSDVPAYTADNGDVVMDLGSSDLQQDAGQQILSHELAHYVLLQLMGGHPSHSAAEHIGSFQAFNEALAISEEQPPRIPPRWNECFPAGQYWTFGGMDSAYANGARACMFLEMQSLIRLVRRGWGDRVFHDILGSLGNHSVEQSLSKYTSVTPEQLQSMWFDRMHQLQGADTTASGPDTGGKSK